MTSTDKQSYWLVNEGGVKAFVVGAAERDRWAPFGWLESSGPVGNEFLYARKEGIADPGLFSAAAFPEAWAPRGWVPCAPPDPDNPYASVAPPTEPAPKSREK